MKRNGRAPSGAQRWRCRSCGASATHSNDVAARELAAFVGWLLSRGTQADMPGRGRTFRRRAALFWPIWPMPEVVDEVFRVVYVDGIWIARDCVVLIACSDEHVLSWHLARAETTAAWRSLLSRIAPPDMVVTDGGSGFASAVAAEWPRTRVQRCVFHAFCQVKRHTTSRPKLQAGVEPLRAGQGVAACGDAPAGRLVGRALHAVVRVPVRLPRAEKPGRRPHGLHPPQAARGEVGLVRLVNAGTLFTYLDPALCAEGPMPATNNRIEGGVNSQLREVLRSHRGLTKLKRVKAVFWWCYLHVECPKTMADTLREMPTDADVDLLRERYGMRAEDASRPEKWGEGLVWEELHHKTRYPFRNE